MSELLSIVSLNIADSLQMSCRHLQPVLDTHFSSNSCLRHQGRVELNSEKLKLLREGGNPFSYENDMEQKYGPLSREG